VYKKEGQFDFKSMKEKGDEKDSYLCFFLSFLGFGIFRFQSMILIRLNTFYENYKKNPFRCNNKNFLKI